MSKTASIPYAGQRAMFCPGGGLPNVPAVVDFVWSHSCVDLKPTGHTTFGSQAFKSVWVLHPGSIDLPSGYYCTLAAPSVEMMPQRSLDDPFGDRGLPQGVGMQEKVSAPVTASIKGYRQLSAADQALINECKELAERCGAMVARLRAMPPSPPTGPVPASPSMEDPFGQRSTIDQRWVSIGATHLQEGWMAIVRGIAQPSNF